VTEKERQAMWQEFDRKLEAVVKGFDDYDRLDPPLMSATLKGMGAVVRAYEAQRQQYLAEKATPRLSYTDGFDDGWNAREAINP